MGDENYQAFVYMTGEDFLRDAKHDDSYEPFSISNELAKRDPFDRGLVRSLESWSIVGCQMVGAEVQLHRR